VIHAQRIALFARQQGAEVHVMGRSARAIDLYASGAVGLGGIREILAGNRPVGAGLGPKLHVDPRLS